MFIVSVLATIAPGWPLSTVYVVRDYHNPSDVSSAFPLLLPRPCMLGMEKNTHRDTEGARLPPVLQSPGCPLQTLSVSFRLNAREWVEVDRNRP